LSPQSKKLVSLAGKLNEYVGYDPEIWVIGDALKAGGSSHVFGTVKLQITQTSIAGNELRVAGKLSGVPRPPVFRLDNGYIYHVLRELAGRGITFESADGTEKGAMTWIEVKEIVAPMVAGGGCGCEFSLILKNDMGKMPAGPRLKATLPRKFSEIPVQFEFKDIELP
jgi:hypothetical protein